MRSKKLAAPDSVNKLVAAVDEALGLLKEFTDAREMGSELVQSPASLLEQCLALCAQRQALDDEPIRTMHQFAGAGGSLIGKCIAAMPNVQVLSTDDPFGQERAKGSATERLGSDTRSLVRRNARGESKPLLDFFLENIRMIYSQAIQSGQTLVIRDQAYGRLFSEATSGEINSLQEVLASINPTLSITVIRHPLDCFLSMQASSWLHYEAVSLEQFCQSYLDFVRIHAELPSVRYEDFVAAPGIEMQRICTLLDIPYSEHFVDLFAVFDMPGTGRQNNRVEVWPRRPIEPSVINEIKLSPSYKALLDVLKYGDDTYNCISSVDAEVEKFVVTGANDLKGLIAFCISAEDIHAQVDKLLESGRLDDQQTVKFLLGLSENFNVRKDKMTAMHFLASAKKYLKPGDTENHLLLSRHYMALGRQQEALDLLVLNSLGADSLTSSERERLLSSYEKALAESRSKEEHGHELVLTYLQANRGSLKLHDRRATLIEIGTTRENVPGQGSTRKLAEYCRSEGLHFITVDMDPHNTHEAEKLFKELGTNFEAVNQKGEDYLFEFQGYMDFVFLDAYDYDHGQHSELRQSRYKKFLGNNIDEALCHKMHLDCAKSVVQKLSPFGVVCVDDSWQVDGKWTAKGALAIPFLLENDFEIVEARNRSVLLGRKNKAA